MVNWPTAFMFVGIAFAIAWLARSFFRVVEGFKP